jgi:voltage-gated potassium channel
MARQPIYERRMRRFMRKPPSARTAASVVVGTTTFVVLLSGAAMRLIDHKEFPNVWLGMWWAVQTVTTVGYGDITPHNVSGRIVAAVVMLEGTAFIAVVTALIAATFVARAQHEYTTALLQQGADADTVEGRLRALGEKLDEIQQELRESRGPATGSS